MRLYALALFAAAAAPALASADVIRSQPAAQHCPPGLERSVSHRGGEHCAPVRCSDDAACGEGARCVEVGWCRRPNPRAKTGRRARQPRRAYVDGPYCDDDAGCERLDGDGWRCNRYRHCEPTAPTPAWDPEGHRWTRQPHPADAPSGTEPSGEAAPAREAEREPEPPTESEDAREQSEEPEESEEPEAEVAEAAPREESGCSAAGGAGSPLTLLLLLALRLRGQRR